MKRNKEMMEQFRSELLKVENIYMREYDIPFTIEYSH